jgi:phosphate transport system protein
MVMEFFRGGADKELEQIEKTIQQMLVDCRHTFDTAINALLGGTDPDVVKKDIKKTDRRVNKAQREVRRGLVVHASVRGAQADIPMVLASMSIVKDAERIGDYAKNIFDMARQGVDLSQSDDLGELIKHRDQVSRLIAETARIFGERDIQAAHLILQVEDENLSEYDALVIAQIDSDASAGHAVPRALLYRYFKRITAHAMNILTSLVMPIHRLDYYDEDKADGW